MVKAKVSYLAPEDAVKLKPGTKTTKQVMRNKLSSTDRRDMLSTIYERRNHSAAKTPIPTPKSVSQKEDVNCDFTTKQQPVQLSNSSGGQNYRFTTQSVPGSLKKSSGAEDRRGKQVGPSAISKSSPQLEEWNDGSKKVGLSSNRKEGDQNFHQGVPSHRTVSGGLKNTNEGEDRAGKQVAPSGNAKSSPHSVISRKSNNSGFRSSLKSVTQIDGYERANSSLNHRGDFSSAQSVSRGLQNRNGVEHGPGNRVSPSLPKSRESNDGCERVDSREVTRKKLLSSDGPMDVIMHTKAVRASSSNMEPPANNVESFVPVNPLHSSNSDASPTNHETQKRKSPKISSGSLKYRRNGPASEIIWKGAFEVLNLSREMGLCEGFVAHPPVKVSEKAYKFSKQIPGVLLFELNSRSKVWPEIFQILSPDWNDVALYFYPGKSESSRSKYSDLLKYMVKNDMVLRSLMGHVELLVYASKALALDCQQMKGSYFMWGVFRPLKGQTRS